MPPDEVGPLREEEERRSAAVVGVSHVEFLGHPDGAVEYGVALRRDFAAAFRRLRPDVVITMNFDLTWGEGGGVQPRRPSRRRPRGARRVPRRGQPLALPRARASRGRASAPRTSAASDPPTHYVDVGDDAREGRRVARGAPRLHRRARERLRPRGVPHRTWPDSAGWPRAASSRSCSVSTGCDGHGPGLDRRVGSLRGRVVTVRLDPGGRHRPARRRPRPRVRVGRPAPQRHAHTYEEVEHTERGSVCSVMYRHDTHTQALTPLNVPCVVAVAPATVDFSSPDHLSLVRALRAAAARLVRPVPGHLALGPVPARPRAGPAVERPGRPLRRGQRFGRSGRRGPGRRWR